MEEKMKKFWSATNWFSEPRSGYSTTSRQGVSAVELMKRWDDNTSCIFVMPMA
jgi:hypothetical protein